jgi:hypothetical protein
MPADVPPSADCAGFTDRAFAARYDGEEGDGGGHARTGSARATLPAAAAQATPGSRNSYMRSRARRLAAGQPG